MSESYNKKDTMDIASTNGVKDDNRTNLTEKQRVRQLDIIRFRQILIDKKKNKNLSVVIEEEEELKEATRDNQTNLFQSNTKNTSKTLPIQQMLQPQISESSKITTSKLIPTENTNHKPTDNTYNNFNTHDNTNTTKCTDTITETVYKTSPTETAPMGHNKDHITKHLHQKGHKDSYQNDNHNIAAKSKLPNQKAKQLGIYSPNTKILHHLIDNNTNHKQTAANSEGMSQMNVIFKASLPETNNHHTSITYQPDINHVSNIEAIPRIHFYSKYTGKQHRLNGPVLATANHLHHNNYQDCT
jgi:hypothetical protein